MKLDMRRALLCSLWLALAPSLSIATGPSPASAQGKPAPGPNQAFLYEMSETAAVVAVGLNPDGTPILHRQATSQLQGVAALGSILCPNPLLVTIPKLRECTVIATGSDDVPLNFVGFDGNGNPILVPINGSIVSGTYAVVVQLDNAVDSPELPVQTGTFTGTLNFQPPLPLAFIAGGMLTIDGVIDQSNNPVLFPFTGTFRLPFAMSANGHHVKPRRGQDAFYLRDNNGKRQPVRPDERAVGWATVRLDLDLPPCQPAQGC